MLLRDLKKIANESLFNPKKPSPHFKIIIDVGNPHYLATRAIEKIMESEQAVSGSERYHKLLKEAISLLILARATTDEKDTKNKKARNNTARKDNKDAKT